MIEREVPTTEAYSFTQGGTKLVKVGITVIYQPGAEKGQLLIDPNERVTSKWDDLREANNYHVLYEPSASCFNEN